VETGAVDEDVDAVVRECCGLELDVKIDRKRVSIV